MVLTRHNSKFTEMYTNNTLVNRFTSCSIKLYISGLVLSSSNGATGPICINISLIMHTIHMAHTKRILKVPKCTIITFKVWMDTHLLTWPYIERIDLRMVTTTSAYHITHGILCYHGPSQPWCHLNITRGSW